MLKARLQEELGHKFNYAQQVREKEEELEKTVEESDNAKSILLARIKQLEEDNARLRGDMANSLDKAAREKEDAMSRAKAQKEKELLESELRRYRDLDKVRLLLTGNTKQGWLNKQGKGILAGWKQRYFVLKDNLLYWYEAEKSVTVRVLKQTNKHTYTHTHPDAVSAEHEAYGSAVLRRSSPVRVGGEGREEGELLPAHA